MNRAQRAGLWPLTFSNLQGCEYDVRGNALEACRTGHRKT
jgi:hypothetical protein